MFTGIIRHTGTIEDISHDDNAMHVHIASDMSKDLSEGDSVAVNGACMTVLSASNTHWRLRLMKESLTKTNLGDCKKGDILNLERPLALGDRLDGHMVQGHVDGIVHISAIASAGDDRIFTFTAPNHIRPYLIPKGSVALDGVSLTVVDVLNNAFTVSIMPYTLEHTTFGRRQVGDHINAEADMIGKYVRSFTSNLCG